MNEGGFTDERLRDSLAEVREPVEGGKDCPAGNRIWLSARGELESGENRDILLHVAECPACAMSWRIARDMKQDSEVRRPAAPARVWRPYRTGLAAAAVLVAAVGLGIFYRPGPVVEQETPYRAQEGTWFRSALDEGAALPREEFVLAWEPGPDGTIYSVLVTSASLEILARGVALESNEFRVPADALSPLPAGSEVLWQVSARLPDERFVESESYVVRVE